jgi:hypothetical protein
VIPANVEELTPAWFSTILGLRVERAEIVDAHSGTTGRARVALRGDPGLPESVFVKLAPFVEQQRQFLTAIGLGVAEARLYAHLGAELPVRIPQVHHSAYAAADGSFVMVLEDLAASGCRFPTPEDDDVVDVAASLMDELALLHAHYAGAELPWLSTPTGMRRKPRENGVADRRTQFIRSALDQFGDQMPAAFGDIAELYIERTDDIVGLFGEGTHTLIHGDTHSGNLFVDGTRTGFYDWAVVGRGPGVRDVAYFLCNSLPTEVRRSQQDSLLQRYRAGLEAHGVSLAATAANDQYRLFSLYSWVAAVSTAAMGSQWQPFELAHTAMVRTTEAVDDLDVLGLLHSRI